MKKILTHLSILLWPLLSFAQNDNVTRIEEKLPQSHPQLILPTHSKISAKQLSTGTMGFETEEGFTLGDVNGQSNWQAVGLANGGHVVNQTVTNLRAFAGTNSLSLGHDPSVALQNFPYLGSFQTFSTLQSEDMEVYFQPVFDGATFYQIANNDLMNGGYYRHMILIYTSSRTVSVVNMEQNNAIVPTGFSVSPNTWYKLKIVNKQNEGIVEYYIDDILIYTRTDVPSEGFLYDQTFVGHTNTTRNSRIYIDDLTYGEKLSTLDVNKKSQLSVYPNPTSNFINIKNLNGEKVESITLGDLTGNTVMYIKSSTDKINIQHLPNGVYLLKVKTDKGFFTQKIIKK